MTYPHYNYIVLGLVLTTRHPEHVCQILRATLLCLALCFKKNMSLKYVPLISTEPFHSTKGFFIVDLYIGCLNILHTDNGYFSPASLGTKNGSSVASQQKPTFVYSL